MGARPISQGPQPGDAFLSNLTARRAGPLRQRAEGRKQQGLALEIADLGIFGARKKLDSDATPPLGVYGVASKL